ncbi:hypothetical protein NCC49_000279 [Naganishia albida]|nr:hypothetical protein NCC49_000279 [Naganishia albida]
MSASGPLEEEEGKARPGSPERRDSISTVASFAFIPPTLPSYLARSISHDDGTDQQQHRLGLAEAVALVVGMQIGSGIFSSPGVIVHSTKSVGSSLVVWLVSGLLAWTGASSFAELGSAIPLNGGAQAYLAYAYSPFVSYLFCWTAVSALKPGSCAIIALIFGEYVNRLIATLTSHEEHPLVADWTIKATASVVVMVITAINLISSRAGSGAQVVLTGLKVASLMFIIVLGFVSLVIKGSGPTFGSGQGVFEGASTEFSSYAIALYSGLWAFDGSDQVNYVAGQLKNPTRDIPRVIHLSMSTVLFLFLAANVSYFLVLPLSVVAQSNTVALDFGVKVFGKIGAVVFSVVVAISCFGALNGSFYTTARLIQSSAKEGFLPKTFARLSSRDTPDNALALQLCITLVFIVFGGGFRGLVNFFSVTSWTFYLLTVAGLIVLRYKEPNLERPYKTWLVTPIVFCVVALFLLLMPVVAAPLEALAAATFILAGIPAYYLTVRASRPAESGRGFVARAQGK